MNGKGRLAVMGSALLAALVAAVSASDGSSSEAAGSQSGGGKGARFFVVTPKPGTLTITQVRIAGLKPNVPKPRIVPLNRKELPTGKERRKATILGYSVVKLPKQKVKSRGASTGERPRILAGTATVPLPIFAETTLYGSVRGAIQWKDPRLDLETAGSQWEIRGKPIRATISSSGKVTNRRGLEAICDSLPDLRNQDWRPIQNWSGSFTGIGQGSGFKPVRLGQAFTLACSGDQGLAVLAGILSGRGAQPPSPPSSPADPSCDWSVGAALSYGPFGGEVGFARPVEGTCSPSARGEIDGVKFAIAPPDVPAGGFLVDASGSPTGGPGSTGAAGKDFVLFGGFGPNVSLWFCVTYSDKKPKPGNQPIQLETIKTDGTRDTYTAKPSAGVDLKCNF